MEKGLVFGLNIGELLTIYDPDLQLWKMSECLFTGDLAKYSEALPKSGMMQSGKIYEQKTWVRRTGGKGFGLLPTPQVFDATCGDLKGKEYNGKSRHAEKLIQAVKRNWPTPTTRDWKDGTAKSCKNVPVNGLLGRAIHKFPTPRAYEGGAFKNQDGTLKASGLKACAQIDGGQLNPTWVDWLMGYPIEWTDLEASEMQLSLK